MRNLILILVMILFGLQTNAQSDLSRLAQQYKGNDAVTSINIGPAVLGILASMSSDEEVDELNDAISNFEGIRILAFDSEGADAESMAFYRDAQALVSSGNFEELMTVESTEETVKFMVQREQDRISNLVLIAQDMDDCVVMQIKGDIDLEALGNISGDIDITGFDQLKKLDCQDGGKGRAY